MKRFRASTDGKIFLIIVIDNVFVCDCVTCSGSDWKYAAEKFVQQLPDRVFVHRKLFISTYVGCEKGV